MRSASWPQASVGALSDEALEVVAIAERNALRLMALINDILDLERLETGMIELEFAQVPVVSILRRAMESLPVSRPEHGITVDTPEVSSMIWADADRIVQVVVNLLSNAVKFSPPGGVVTIGVGLRERSVEFRVTRPVAVACPWPTVARSSNGSGRWRRPTRARRAAPAWGSRSAKSIVEQHGGTIGVESDGRTAAAPSGFGSRRGPPQKPPRS